jgi:hypothetical protein
MRITVKIDDATALAFVRELHAYPNILAFIDRILEGRLKTGMSAIDMHALPAQGDIAPEELALWYEQHFGFDTRIASALWRAGIYPAQLLTMDEKALRKTDRLGKKSITTILATIRKMGSETDTEGPGDLRP